ncbi:MAG TPA: 3-hydroxybutyrate dehydrogenase [Thermohalobaculum sp.]|nr:3-hydroxybutyrate dehydrogenase [Thermohalobaculum sp.]
MTLNGKVSVVTGSTSGIGLGIAKELANRGSKVVLNSHSENEKAQQATREMTEETGVEVAFIRADMGKVDECRALIEQAVERFGGVDILVNNAGIQHVAPIEEFPVEKWDAILAINLSSAFHTTAAAVPAMRARGWGRIVNISSAHGLTASPYKSAYVAAKHGMMGLTKVVALETAKEDITCNAVCPGYVLTPLVEKQIPDTMKQYGMDRETAIRAVLLERQPSKKFATVEQIGGTVAFLCSEDAAEITGTSISIDGGWTAL